MKRAHFYLIEGIVGPLHERWSQGVFHLMVSGDGSCPTYPYHCIVPKPVAELVKVATIKILPNLPTELLIRCRQDEVRRDDVSLNTPPINLLSPFFRVLILLLPCIALLSG